jgi:hypothetical protein
MEWFISHSSALEFWRKALPESKYLPNRVRTSRPPTKLHDTKELLVADLWKLTSPYHILVGQRNARKENCFVQSHVSSEKFPHGSFIQASEKLIVSCPELCFLQMANELTFLELVSLGYELCGTYRLTEQCRYKAHPLTSKLKLKSFTNRAFGFDGKPKVEQAFRYIADNSASPMETILSMMLSLPYRLGGYGFPLPLLNHLVEINQGTGKSSRYYCDLFWPDAQVDVEYDSDGFHALPERIAKDAARRNALSSAGITVITVTRGQIVNAGAFNKVASELSKLLKKRLAYKKQEFVARHANLRRSLLPRAER